VLEQAVADGAASDVRVLWMGNALLFSAQPAVIERLAGLPGIDRLQRLVDRPAEAYQDAPAPVPFAPAPAPPPAAPATPGPEPNLVQLQAPALWAAGADGSGVLLATLDSGVWWQHPDLVNRVWLNPGEIDGNLLDDDNNGFVDDVRGWDFVNGSPDVTNFDGHGTRSAGIAVGDGSGGMRLTGMAPGATLLVCEVNDEDEYWLAQQYCLEAGVDVVTSSYSYKWLNNPRPDYHMHRQLCTMELAAGIVHANSVGNQGSFQLSYPIPFNIATRGSLERPRSQPEATVR
ncbi:MAG TPA: S8 family serine peptidase, partial [Planctomycetota bacterium]|nr:S8 family serine peptidase [Planctomycetota bacterium]